MLKQQKDAILALLKIRESEKNYESNYWFSYKDFLDTTESFADFACEHLDEKQGYLTLVENLLHMDETAKVFVEVYGYEEDHNNSFIYADTLILFSKLPLSSIKQIFNAPKDIFPSDVGILPDYNSLTSFIIGENGDVLPAENYLESGYTAYYCWWD